MGGHQSTVGFVQEIVEYKDAIQRFDKAEIAMLQKVFKTFGTGTTVNKLAFTRNALSMVPEPLQTRLYQVFGGNPRSIGIQDAACGLCVFLKGTVREKKQLVFMVYDVDDTGLLSQSRMLSMLLPGEDRKAVIEAFPKGAEVGFRTFEKWSAHNPAVTELIKWTNFPPPPHFCKTTVPSDMKMLAEISNLSSVEAKVLQTRYHDLRSTFYIRGQKFTAKALQPMACPPFTPPLLARLCYLWGDDRGGEVAFREVLQGVSVCCRGSPEQQTAFLFKIFDIGAKGYLDHTNIRMLLTVVDELKHAKDRSKDNSRERTISSVSITSKDEFEDDTATVEEEDELDDLPPGDNPFEVGPDVGNEDALKEIFSWDDGERLTQKQFAEWANKAKATINALKKPLAFVGHTVFALRPQLLEAEGRVVGAQMRQDEVTKSLRKHGNQCYLLSRSWYDAWRVHVGLERPPDGGVGRAPPPGPIDNNPLMSKPTTLVDRALHPSSKRNFTKRGLKKGLVEDRDFVVISETVWAMLSLWYTGEPRIYRPAIARDGGAAKIELYPLAVRVLQHVGGKQDEKKKESADGKKEKGPTMSFLLMTECSRTQTIKQLARSICLQQKGMKRGNPQLKPSSVRLWDYDDPTKPRLLEPEWEAGELHDGQTVLLEVRNRDLSWPSELAMAMTGGKKGKAVETVFGATVKREPGATGLSNLGNTCFLNAAVQCLSNTEVLREYFLRKCYRAEINRTNVLGSKGAVAMAQSELINRLWCGKTSVAPSRLRETVIKHGPQFQGYEQHDSQEFLNFVIDALHEDLNRVAKPPYVERQDSNMRPDHVVATESWEAHEKRNRSVIVDLLHGQLKSTLRCKACRFESVSFDPFTFLTLPLPTENETTVDIKLTRQRGGAPEVFSIAVEQGCTFAAVKRKFVDLITADSDCSDVSADAIIFVEFPGTVSQRLIDEKHKLRQMKGHLLYAYEVRPDVVEAAQAAVGQALDSDLTDTEEGAPSDGSPSPQPARPSAESVASAPAPTPSDDSSARSTRSSLESTTKLTKEELAAEDAKRFVIPGHVFAIHRKKESMATHFLTLPHRHTIFGSPLLIPIVDGCTNAALYDFVWAQVSHFLVPQFQATVDANRNFPFELTQLGNTRVSCDPRKCTWGRCCTGCVIPNTADAWNGNAAFIGIDWKPREYCLYFDVSQDTRFNLHKSVEALKAKEKEPIELAECIKAFTKEEDMGTDDLWYCPKCKEHKEATKKLDIWALPPVLIIHLKRFHMLNGRWVKSQRHVNFPVTGLDVFQLLETRPAYEPVNPNAGNGVPADVTHTSNDEANGGPGELELVNCKSTVHTFAVDTTETDTDAEPLVSSADGSADTPDPAVPTPNAAANGELELVNDKRTVYKFAADTTETDTDAEPLASSADASAEERTPADATAAEPAADAESPSSAAVPIIDSNLSAEGGEAADPALALTRAAADATGSIIPHMDKLDPHAKFYTDPAGPRVYDLTSMTIHLGIMGGGHYVSYAKNPNDKWYYYNDSSCKEVTAERVGREDGYCLFYSARGVDLETILPQSGDEHAGVGSDQEDDDDDGRMKRDNCVIS